MWQERSKEKYIYIYISLQQHKAPSEKANSKDCTDPDTNKRSPAKQSVFIRPNLKPSNIGSPSYPAVTQLGVSVYEITTSLHKIHLTEVVFSCLLESQGEQQTSAGSAERGLQQTPALPQFPHKWNYYSTTVKVWEPSEEKQHYLENYFNTKMKLSRGTPCPCPFCSCRKHICVQIRCTCKENKGRVVYRNQFGALQGGIFPARVFLREEGQCVLTSSLNNNNFRGPVTLRDDSQSREHLCFFP